MEDKLERRPPDRLAFVKWIVKEGIFIGVHIGLLWSPRDPSILREARTISGSHVERMNE